jgi:hypothetical protein
MYLLVFTILVMGLLNIYTQVMAIQVGRIYQSQTGIGQAMIAWHEAALSIAGNIVEPKMGSAGCSLTAAVVMAACPVGLGVVTAAPSATVTAGNPGYAVNSFVTGGVTYPSWPVGYTSNTYQWKSVAYQTGSYYYVITYADPPATPGGFVSTASASLGVTQGDLFQEVKNTGIPNNDYGYVSSAGGTLNTSATLPGVGPISYPVPPTIPPNSFAIISAPGTCSTC